MESFIVSKNAIKDVIKNSPNYISKVFIAEDASGKDIEEIVFLLKKSKVSFVSVPRKKLLKIYNKGYSGILAVLSPVKYFEFEQFLEEIKVQQSCIIVVLDEITDPQNFGSILRSCAAFEVDGVIIQQWNQVQVTQTVIDVARGGANLVPIVKVKNIYNCLRKLKNENISVYATTSNNNEMEYIRINEIDSNKIAVIFGNENKGIRKNVLSECDGFIKIEHSNKIQSLNVSVACGIIVHQLYMKRVFHKSKI